MSVDASVAKLELPSFSYDAQAAQKVLNLWVGASSVFWAPFWAASTAGLSFWMMREGVSRVAPAAGFSDELPPAFRNWLSARSLWFSGVAPVAEVVEDAADAAFDIANDVPEAVLKVVDAAEDVVSAAIEVMTDISETVVETVVEEPLAPALKPTKEAAALAVSKTPVETVAPKTTRKPKKPV